MNKGILSLVGGHFAIFIAQIVIFFVCVTYIEIFYANNVLPDKVVNETYTPATCTVLLKKLSEKGRLVHKYRADFLISYVANEVNYRTWATGNGLDQAYFSARQPQEETLSQFEVNESYPCWYNPQTPQIAVLVLRHDWRSTLPLLVPTVLAIIAMYYVVKEILQFFGIVRYKTREILDKKKKQRKRNTK